MQVVIAQGQIGGAESQVISIQLDADAQPLGIM
jgi:hypothetical protein